MPHVSIQEAMQRARQMLGAGRASQAAFVYQQVVQQDPGNFEAHLNLGVALAQTGRFDESDRSFHAAARLRPDHHGVHVNLGHAHRRRDEIEAAIRCFRRAVELEPRYAPAYQGLGSACREIGRLDEALAAFRRAVGLQPDFHRAHSNLVYLLYFHPGHPPAAVFEEHRTWAGRHADRLAPAAVDHSNVRDPDRRLRVGFVSPDLRHHVIGLYFEPVLEHLDKEQFDTFCYSDAAQADEVTARLKRHAGQWRDTRALDDAQLAAQVSRDGVDVLVDLTLHMAGHRLLAFARRPAPVQMTYLAYPGTSGMSAMGYKITDVHLDPPGMTEPFHSERLLRLGGCYWCYRPPEHCPDVNPLPAHANGGRVTFGALNAFAKVNPEVLRLWARVLDATPGSRLLLLVAGGERNEGVRRMLADAGMPQQDRVELLGRANRADFHRYFHRVDVSLDPFPYNGHTTSLDSLWMGVPVVTLEGSSSVGRAGVSILTNLGLPELIARGDDEYVATAVSLASDPPALAALRAGLRERMRASPLCDGPRIGRDVGALIRQAWRAWCE